MTVKDLAELSLKWGLVCQNVSAAAQAITSFIRNHLHRCDVEQDFPLLLRHVLSGTSRDDNLVPALYSLSGGNVGKDKAQPHQKSDKDKGCKEASDQGLSEEQSQTDEPRATCFRRGTTVWYLSKAAGAPCPFARCGIALRDYADVPITSERRRGTSTSDSPSAAEDDTIGCRAGIKRKREMLRRHTTAGNASSGSEAKAAEGRRPTKVVLTLRLKPNLTIRRETRPESSSEDEGPDSSSDSDSDSSGDEEERDSEMCVEPETSPPQPVQPPTEREPEWPPFPIQRRISIPPYTPGASSSTSYNITPQTPFWSTEFSSQPFQRASSVPMSVASPPPDSEDEDEDFHISMTREREREQERDMEWEVSTADTEGTRSPERDAPHMSEGMFPYSPVIVKAEDDVTVGGALGGMLDAWERLDFNTTASSFAVKQELGGTGTGVKIEELDLDPSAAFDIGSPESVSDDVWPSHPPVTDPLAIVSLPIKREDDFEDTTARLGGQDEHIVVPPTSAIAGAPGEHLWKDVELFGPDAVEFEDGEWESEAPVSESSLVDGAHVSFPSTPRAPALSTASTSSSSYSPCPVTPSPDSKPSLLPQTDLTGMQRAEHFNSPAYAILQSNDTLDNTISSSSTAIPPQIFAQLSRKSTPARPHVTLPPHEPYIGASGEPTTPWERGMISHWDMDDHLPPPRVQLSFSHMFPTRKEDGMGAGGALLFGTGTGQEPLSPQEEEMFRALCTSAEWEHDQQPAPAPAVVDPAHEEDTAPTHEGEDEEDEEEEEKEPNVSPNVAAVKERLTRSTRAPPLRRSQRVAHLTAQAAQPTPPRPRRGRPRKRTTA
ncbi:hypothetical protein BD410DRAFT_782651 [Rickenella mellea]|uniref:Uncharacterized protein n=1 Tax=Rickenella mellea TaxID=50990 RepID=A0A4Y7QJH1_9AGAM|nr:hypothetical protein BD410DRAFT_782651 [Rickenella mellea]